MSLLVLAKKLIEVTAKECREKRQTIAGSIRRAICKEVHLKQFEEIEKQLSQELSKVFSSHINQAKTQLEQLSGKDASDAIAHQIANIQNWMADLINTAFPILANGMQQAAESQWMMMGEQLPVRSMFVHQKMSAMDWIHSVGLEIPPGLSFLLPDWMAAGIASLLRLAFLEDYWQKIAETTRNDIETFLRVGIQEGESLQTIARKIHNQFPEEYSYRRGILVARTESANCLNGARDLAFQQFRSELPPEAAQYIGKSWVSVLDERTRDNHANLNGVIADKNGMWNLGGHMIPWPGHFSLPPEERCNCRCTFVHEYGVQPDEFSGQPIQAEE